MKIEMIEPRWADPGLKDYCEFLQRQIAEAFRLPPWTLHSVAAEIQFLAAARLQTALLERELVSICEKFTSPQARIIKED